MLGTIAGLALIVLQQSSAPPAPCAANEFHQFDFWVGEWDVYPRANPERLVAHSRIEGLHGGCAIREHWMPLGGTGGSSLSYYDPADDRWHQLWVGSAPGGVQFEGGLVGGQMVITGFWPGSGPNGEDGLTRMSYTRLGEDEVRQHGEFSGDHGVTWVTSFDFSYKRRSEPL